MQIDGPAEVHDLELLVVSQLKTIKIFKKQRQVMTKKRKVLETYAVDELEELLGDQH